MDLIDAKIRTNSGNRFFNIILPNGTFWDQAVGKNLVSNGDAESSNQVVSCNGSKIDPISKWHRRSGIGFSVVNTHISTVSVELSNSLFNGGRCYFRLISNPTTPVIELKHEKINLTDYRVLIRSHRAQFTFSAWL